MVQIGEAVQPTLTLLCLLVCRVRVKLRHVCTKLAVCYKKGIQSWFSVCRCFRAESAFDQLKQNAISKYTLLWFVFGTRSVKIAFEGVQKFKQENSIL